MDNEMRIEQPVPSAYVTRINFSVLTEEDAVKTAVKVIGAVNEVTDPTLGMPNPSYQCHTCGIKDVKTCEGHFGLIKFPFTILDPYYVAEVAQILNKICPGCKSIRSDRMKSAHQKKMPGRPKNCKYCDGSLRDNYPTMKFKVSSKDIFGKTAIIVEANEKLSKRSLNMSSNKGLAPDYWDIIPADAQLGETILKSKKKVLSHAQVYQMLKDVDQRLIEEFVGRKNSIFLNCLLVTPNNHRVTELGKGVIFDDRTRYYKRLIDFRGTANELSAHVIECLKISKVHSEKSSIKEFAPVPSPNLSGLKFIKEALLSKRTGHIFRMVVVGDPNLKLNEIGIPCCIAERLQISEYLNQWNKDRLSEICDLMFLGKGEVFIRRKGELGRLKFMDNVKMGDAIQRPLTDGDVVLINRPPSIHQHSLIALSVKVLPVNSVLSINPLICSPFRGDFDGDCLHGYVPQSVETSCELRELTALNKQLINGQNGRNLLSLSHDSLTAAHLVLEDGVLLNLFEMQQLQMFCPENYFKPLACSSCMWTGKQLFSLLLPPDFDFIFPKNAVRICKGELASTFKGSSWLQDTEENIFYCLVKHCQEKALNILFAAQQVLSEWLAMRGLSVSLSDLYLSSDLHSRKNMMDEVSYALREAERLSHIRLLMVGSNRNFLVGSFDEDQHAADFSVERMCNELQKSAALSRASVAAFKQLFWDIQNLAYQHTSKENSFLAMIKAGSKGNLMKLVQHGMCLGLQHSLVPLSFMIPHELSCTAWNNQKKHASVMETHNVPECANSYIPYAIVESSFLTGLNPLECLVHSITARDSSFSGHADVSGTLTRRLMFFMRDLYIGYDGTVRNAYGSQLVQFSYKIEDASPCNVTDGRPVNESAYSCDTMSGHPVGALAACAISEAAYSALDQPVSALESSPLLNLKSILECGVRKNSGDKTASLYLSRKLGKWIYGFEYGALEVKNHLERLLFSDIVSAVTIFLSPQTGHLTGGGPWVCHFQISKESAKRRSLKSQSIIETLCMKYKCTRAESKINLPNLHITRKDCYVHDKLENNDSTICITVEVVRSKKTSSVQLEILKDMVIPCLLGTVIKGFVEVKKVDILWKDRPSESKSCKGNMGELYLRVFMSEDCNRMKFWRSLMESCLQIMDMIDWERSHPDDIHDITTACGIDVARKCFLASLKSAISDTGKNILPQHLLLAADCLSATGEFVSLNPKGLSQQRLHTSVSSPFLQACFSSPGDCFLKAAKMGVADDLQGNIDALSWGRVPSIGTGGRFDIIYSGKGHQPSKPQDIYNLLGCHMTSDQQNVKVNLLNQDNHVYDKHFPRHLFSAGDSDVNGHKDLTKTIIRKFVSFNDIRRLSESLKKMLQRYDIDDQLSDDDKAIAMRALYFHPRRNEKIGIGAREIKVGHRSEFEDSRCFVLERTDGTVEDFSYHKCVHHALELIAPQRAKTYHSRWLRKGM